MGCVFGEDEEALAGVGAAGATLLLGLWRLDVPTPHYDEPLYVAVGRRYLDGDLNHILGHRHPPVATYAFGVAQLLFGEGIPSARLASLAAGVVTTFFGLVVGVASGGSKRCCVCCVGVGLFAAVVEWLVRLARSLSGRDVAFFESITTMFMVAAVWAGVEGLVR